MPCKHIMNEKPCLKHLSCNKKPKVKIHQEEKGVILIGYFTAVPWYADATDEAKYLGL